MRHAWMERLLFALACALGVSAAAVQAQSYPAKPIRLVLGYAPGGVADITARLVTQKLSASLGQQVIVDNRPSAGGIVAGEAVAKADPDGYTLLHLNAGNAITVALFKSVPFDVVRDFAPIIRLGSFDILMLVPKESKLGSLKDLIAAAKANPEKFNQGAISAGSTQHLAAELFKVMTGLSVPTIPFKTTPNLVTALRSNDIQVAFEITAPVMGMVKSGELRALAISAPARFPGIPDVPTVNESGVGNYQVGAWNGMAAPLKAPREVIERMNRESNAALAQPDLRAKFLELGMSPLGGTPDQLKELLVSDISKWEKVVAAAKIEKQ
jgi:tripartite-type tricarboxylate transporter receptor subunit TctC